MQDIKHYDAETFVKAFLKFSDDEAEHVPDEVTVGMALYLVKQTKDVDGALKLLSPSLQHHFERTVSELDVA